MESRPGKVTAAAVMLFISAVLAAAGAVFITVASMANPAVGASWEVMGAAALSLGFAVGYGFLGYQVLRGRPWARIATMVVLALGIAVDIVVSALTGDWRCSGWLFAIAVIALLNSGDAVHYFARPATSSTA